MGRGRLGCAAALAALNILVMGLVAWSFGQGPYSGAEQEAWYRYRSLAFFVFGAVIPAATLYIGRKSAKFVQVAVVWLSCALALFAVYVMYSGGGV